MPNLVEAIRNRILAEHPAAQVVARGERHVRHLLETLPDGRPRFATVSGPLLHYHDGSDWQEINTDFVDSAEVGFTDEVTAASFIVRGDGNSRKRLYPRRDRLGEYAEFARLQAESGVSFINIPWSSRQRTDDAVTFDRANASLTLRHIGGGIEVLITLKDPSAATSPDTMRARWPVSLVGLHRVGWQLVSDADNVVVATIRPPVITHAGNVELETPRPVQCAVVGGAVEFTADLTGLAYPIVIDPTVTVGASGDDGYITGTSIDTAGLETWAGAFFGTTYHAWRRYTGYTGLSGATIDVAYETLRCKVIGTGTALTKLYAEDATAPAAPTTAADYNGRTMTTAAVDWDLVGPASSTDRNSPSIISIIQELADSYDPSVIQLFQKDDGTAGGADLLIKAQAWDFTTVNCGRLYIEYTAGGGPTGPFKGSLALLGCGR